MEWISLMYLLRHLTDCFIMWHLNKFYIMYYFVKKIVNASRED